MINASGGSGSSNQSKSSKPPQTAPAIPVSSATVQTQPTPTTTPSTKVQPQVASPINPNVGTASAQPPQQNQVGSTSSQTTTSANAAATPPTPNMPPTTPPVNPNQPATSNSTGGSKNGSGSKSALKKPKKKLPWKIIGGVVALLVVLIGAGAGYFLTQINQDVRQQASTDTYPSICTSTGTTECIDDIVYECIVPGSRYQRTNPEETCGQNACLQSLGLSEYDRLSGECVNRGDIWNDTSCSCISGTTNCFTLNDQCQTFRANNCAANGEPDNETSFPNSTTCQAALAESGFEECTQSEIDTCTQAGGTCVYNENLNRGTCQGITAGNTCNTTAECRVNGGNLVCEQNRCVQPTNTGGTARPTPSPTGGATGTGNCSSCIGLGGGQAERDCYAQCSGTIATGICAGMSTTQCQQACSNAGGTAQICTGTQEPAGSIRAGEFLSCGASSVNGCGQFDCLDSSGNLIGFVIDNSQCTGTGGTTNPTSSPTSNPTASPASTATVQPSASVTPSPTSSASPSPTPTLNPDLAQCDEACTDQSDCADLQHTCYQGACRLIDYETRDTCDIPGQGTPTPVPVTSPVPASCNEACTRSSDCNGFNLTCDSASGRCRLSSNPSSQSCSQRVVNQSSTTQLGQMNQQPQAPSELPTAGAKDFSNWILSGLGAVAVGAVILLLL